MSEPQRYIWIRTDAQSRWLWKHLAHYLAALTGWRPLLIVTTAEDRRYYENSFGIPLDGEVVVGADYYAYVVNGGNAADTLEAVRQRAAAYERTYEFSIMRDMLLPDRHLGRGFMVDGKGHPRSNISDNASLRLALGACVVSLEFHVELAERCPPALILSWSSGGGIGGKPLALLARKRGIPFRTLASARFGNLYFWAENELCCSPTLNSFIRRFRMPTAGEQAAIDARLTPTALVSPPLVARFHRSYSWPGMARSSAMAIARRLYARWKGYRRARIGYHLSEQILAGVRSRQDWHWLARVTRPNLDDVSGKVVYFPLQLAPEITTSVFSSHNSNQFAVLMELALSVPSDVTIVVKEHLWQIGRRPRHIYRDMLALPNVVMVNPNYSSLDIIRRSEAVCALSSSAAYEAAVLGKHVFHAHPGCPLEALEHAHLFECASDLSKLTEALANDNSEARGRRQRDGARFLLALEDYCLDWGSTPFHLRQTAPQQGELEQLVAALAKTGAVAAKKPPPTAAPGSIAQRVEPLAG